MLFREVRRRAARPQSRRLDGRRAWWAIPKGDGAFRVVPPKARSAHTGADVGVYRIAGFPAGYGWWPFWAPDAEPGGALAKDLGSGPILIVEDDPEILGTVADILEFEGYEVERASNGLEALRIIEQVRPRLVLLDMRMPVLDGWDFAKALEQRNIYVPILVMTAAADARRWAQEIGAAGYLAKPFDLSDLLSVVARFAT